MLTCQEDRQHRFERWPYSCHKGGKLGDVPRLILHDFLAGLGLFYLVEAKGQRNVWARFYELTTARPIFGMYDFVRLYSLDEVSLHRRMSYGWYSKNVERVIERDYPRWKQQHNIE